MPNLRALLPALVLIPVLAVSACGKDDGADESTRVSPVIGVRSTDEKPATDLGFPAFATANTTRVAGADGPAIAAGVARAMFPAADAATRPEAVTLVDGSDWRTALAASALIADPVRAPILLSDGSDSPKVTTDTLAALRPTGSEAAGGAQVIRVGDVPRPARLKTTDLPGSDPFALARQIDAFATAARGRPSERVVVVSADDPAYAMPAAGWAAKSGDPILFVRRGSVPAATKAALSGRQRPRIYVLGPSKVVSPTVTKELRKLGTVVRVGDQDPVKNAIAFARFRDGTFGWGVTDPGHGIVVINTKRPEDAAAAAGLSSSGSYGPQVLVRSAGAIPGPLSTYLLAIQPGHTGDPVRGVYNHGWIIGDEDSVSIASQARLDAVMRIVPVRTTPVEPEPTPPTTTATTPARTTTAPTTGPTRTATAPTRTATTPTPTATTQRPTRTAPAPTTTTPRSAP